MSRVAIVQLDLSGSWTTTGVQEYDRDNGGAIIFPATSGLPVSTFAGELVWDIVTSSLYRRNSGDTAWEQVQAVPTAHASTHQHGGADEIATATPGVDAIPKSDGTGKLATGWLADATETAKGVAELATSAETTAGLVVQASDTRLSDPRTPVAHASSHQHGGSDEVATAAASANAIPKATGSGALSSGWVDDTTHGARGGGTLHAGVVPAGAAGFMTGADKTKIDGIAAGAAALTGSAPEDVDAAAASVGVGATAARSDHKHDISTGVAAANPPGTASVEGASNSLARADHTHGLAAFGATAGTFTEGDDTRLSDARTPVAHAASHQHGGSDEVATATAAANAIPKATASGVLANAWVSQASVTQHEAAINHDALTNYVVGQHRIINDSGTATTELWSANKISTELAAVSAGIDIKDPALTATLPGDGNISLTGEQTIRGVLTSASRVLLTDQTLPEANGLWLTGPGAWARPADFDTSAEVTNGASVDVVDPSSSVYRYRFVLTTPDPIVLGTTGLSFANMRPLDFGVTGGTATEGNDTRVPSQDENNALAGTNGAPSAVNPYVTDTDPRNTNSRAPTAHASTHQHGGADEVATVTAAANAIPKAGGAGTLSAAWLPAATDAVQGAVELATGAETAAGLAVQASDPRLSDPRAPTAHASTHQHGGTDEVATSVAGANAIPKAAGTGALAAGWIDDASHGALSGGTQHAVAVASVSAGFLSGADKSKLDGVASGAAALTASAPANVTKSAAVVGVATDAARADHKHDITTAAATTLTAATANAEGAATTLARSNHTHAVTTGSPGATSVATAGATGSSASIARADHVHQSNTAPANVTKASAAIGTSGEPARADHKHDITTATAAANPPGTASAEGVSTSLARADHTHGLAAFGAGAGTFAEGNDSRLSDDRTASGLRTATTIVVVASATAPTAGQVLTATSGTAADWQAAGAGVPSATVVSETAYGQASSAGASAEYSRGDHTHGTPALSSVAPENVTKSAATVGVATTPARADHKHDIATAAPSSVGTANAEGSSTSIARADHIHNHGAQTDGTHHAAAIPSGASGFLTGADKSKLDGVASGAAALTASAPANVTKSASVVGVATDAARADHKHDISTAAASANPPGTSNAEGASTSLARADHTHALAAFGTGSGAFAEGNDSRLSDDRTASGLRSATTTVVVSAASAPTSGQVLTATSGTAANWQTPAGGGGTPALTVVPSTLYGLPSAVGVLTSFAREDHTHGSPSLTSSAPANVTKAAAVVGVAITPARADHKHDISTAAATTLTATTTNTEGAATSLARSNHTHAVTSAAPGATGVATASAVGVATTFARSDHAHQSNTAPENVTKAAAAIGTSGQPARADHKHDITTAVPVNIAGALAEGTSTSLARADHAHTIPAGFVTNAMGANMAANSVKANPTGGAAVAQDLAIGASTILGRLAAGVVAALTGTQVTTLLDAFTSGLKGLAPASGGGTTNFLRADGTWAAPPGGGGFSPVTISAYDSTGNLGVTSGTPVTIALDATHVADAGFSLSSNVITVTNAGRYRISWSITVRGNGAGTRVNYIGLVALNGSELSGTRGAIHGEQSGYGSTCGGTTEVNLAASDTLELQTAIATGSGNGLTWVNGSHLTVTRVA